MASKYASFALLWLSIVCLGFGSPQKHPPVASGAPETSAKHLHSLVNNGGKVLIIDVRTREEYSKSHVPEAINIPVEELPQRIRQMHVSKDTTIVTMCDHGGRSSRAALELQKMGYKAASYCRIDAWKKSGYPTQAGKPERRRQS